MNFKDQRIFKDQKVWEYYANFPFDVYNNWYGKKTMIPKYVPQGFLYDHEISDQDNVVYVNEQLKQVVWSVRGTDLSNNKDVWNDIKIVFGGTDHFVQSPYYHKWLHILYKYRVNISNLKKQYKIIFSSHSLGASVQQGLILHTFEHDIHNQALYVGPDGLLIESPITEEQREAIYNKHYSYNLYHII